LPFLLSVNLFRRKRSLLHDSCFAPALDGAKKAAPETFVANAWTHCFNPHKQGIRVAVHANLADPQDVTAGFTLFPKLVPRSAKKYDFAAALCFL